jgi:L-2-hydroxyglutarate oxidase LhgO
LFLKAPIPNPFLEEVTISLGVEMASSIECDVLIIGAGVIGLSIGIALLESKPNLKVIIVEKEKMIAHHASGRNSGVLHAGFYYSPDSLKAKFCRQGNFEFKKLARENHVPIREVGKIVVSKNELEDEKLSQLLARGIDNGVDLEILNKKELLKVEPLAVTFERFLWSPTTAVVDTEAMNQALLSKFLKMGGDLNLEQAIKLLISEGEIVDASGKYIAKHFINAAGAYADRISRSVGVGLDYAMLPFLGLYRSIEEKSLPLQRLVYPVPHPINPFLGVHFTLTIDNKIKVGPTAIPITGREQYSLREGWSISDTAQSLKAMSSLVSGKSHKFGEILRSEWPNLIHSHLIAEASKLVPSAINTTGWKKKPAGIRAQLVHLPTGRLEQDFIVREEKNSTHILNAVSPGWTSAIPFGRWITEKVLSEI